MLSSVGRFCRLWVCQRHVVLRTRDVNVLLWENYAALMGPCLRWSRSRATTGRERLMRSLLTSGGAAGRSRRSASAAASGWRNWRRA
jgi:hypothetical protein